MSFLWWSQGPRKPVPQGRQRRCRPALELLEERAVPAGGDLDLSFSVDGKQTVGFDLGGPKFDMVAAMAFDAQGRIVLAGSADVGNFTTDFAVVRLNPDGSLDTTFSGDGKQTVAFDLAVSTTGPARWSSTRRGGSCWQATPYGATATTTSRWRG